MERNGRDKNESGASQQNTLWKQFQARAKPLLSPKLGSRDPDGKKERCGWMFKKTRKENLVLDRVISSSQPDLLFPSQVEAKEAQLCNKHAGTCSVVCREKLQSTCPNKPTVARLVQSHHKSSSLGSACLERLAEPPDGGSGSGSGGGEAATAAAAAAEEAAGGPQLESRDEESVSSPICPSAARLCGLNEHGGQFHGCLDSTSVQQRRSLYTDYYRNHNIRIRLSKVKEIVIAMQINNCNCLISSVCKIRELITVK